MKRGAKGDNRRKGKTGMSRDRKDDRRGGREAVQKQNVMKELENRREGLNGSAGKKRRKGQRNDVKERRSDARQEGREYKWREWKVKRAREERGERKGDKGKENEREEGTDGGRREEKGKGR